MLGYSIRRLVSQQPRLWGLSRISSNYYSIRKFSNEIHSQLPEGIKSFLERENITQPTIIQEKTFKFALENKDLVGVARTGSGKTLAFAIPAVMKILKSRETESSATYDIRPPRCLVLAPTRELANQTHELFSKFRFLKINSIPLVGGSSRSEQIRSINNTGFDVYVATPGRLMDLLESNIADLSKIEYLVLDEADRMLDMGFEPQIRRILQTIPTKRQTLMWSATWPKEIQSLASEFMRDYEYIAVDSENLKANPNIKQIIKVCQPMQKLPKLMESLNEFKNEVEDPRILVFVNTKRLADSLLIQMMRNRIKAISMHGDRSQRQRDDALRLFKSRLCNVLIATDVAARGLDISDITHVVNFDFPRTIEDYIHRIGRTARHDRKGTSVSLFTEGDASLSRKLVEVLKETGQEIPVELEDFARNQHRYKSTTSSRNGMRARRPDYYSSGSSYGSRNRAQNSWNYDTSDSRYTNQQQWSNNYSRRQHDDGYGQRSRNQYRDDDEFDDEYDDDRRSSRGSRQFKTGSLFQD